jgi:redox-sensitive bicupin YhaK (pirin superfamily)
MMKQTFLVIEPPEKDLGGFKVRRALPSVGCRHISYFVFFDHMGPAEMSRDHGMDVRPHPHINLATVTYLFEGSIMHRDSLGTQQLIEAGDVNWMTAGRGIVHSERTPREGSANLKMHGIQIWVALPKEKEEIEPSFSHHAEKTLPFFKKQGAQLRLILGEIFGQISPVQIDSKIFYLDAHLAKSESLDLDLPLHAECGIYIISGSLQISSPAHEDKIVSKSCLVSIALDQKDVVFTASENCHFVIFGGEPLAEPRHIWWNFVSTSKERIEQAKVDWSNQSMGQVPGETEFIPLPKQ